MSDQFNVTGLRLELLVNEVGAFNAFGSGLVVIVTWEVPVAPRLSVTVNTAVKLPADWLVQTSLRCTSSAPAWASGSWNAAASSARWSRSAAFR